MDRGRAPRAGVLGKLRAVIARQGGQSAIEYVGVTLVSAILVLTLAAAAPEIRTGITGALERAVCTLEGGGDCPSGDADDGEVKVLPGEVDPTAPRPPLADVESDATNAALTGAGTTQLASNPLERTEGSGARGPGTGPTIPICSSVPKEFRESCEAKLSALLSEIPVDQRNLVLQAIRGAISTACSPPQTECDPVQLGELSEAVAVRLAGLEGDALVDEAARIALGLRAGDLPAVSISPFGGCVFCETVTPGLDQLVPGWGEGIPRDRLLDIGATEEAARTFATRALDQFCSGYGSPPGTGNLCSEEELRENHDKIVEALLRGDDPAELELERDEDPTTPPWYDPFNLITGGVAAATAKLGVRFAKKAIPAIIGGSSASGVSAGAASSAFSRLSPTLRYGALRLSLIRPSAGATNGIYVIRKSNGSVYVGQSGDISARLAQHVKSGRYTQAEVNAAERFSVGGGKTAREMAEQMKLNSPQIGGRDAPGVLNKVNPIGKNRRSLFPNWYRYPGD